MGRQWIADWIEVENGSGLSRIERVSARDLGQMLLTAYRSPVMPEFMASMPLVGVDGTEGSVEALRWAAHEAARRSWPLHVITCAELPVAVEAGMVGNGAVTGSAMDGIVAEQEAVNQRAVALAR